MGHGTWDMGRFSRSGSLSYPETVDFVLILVDSKCNFVTCEFVTISTSNNRSRKVILIYNILYIYIKYYYLLFVISSSILIFLPTYISNLLNVTNSHVTKYNFLKMYFPDQVDSFFNCSNCSFVCLFAPMSHTLYTSNAQSAAFRSALGSPPLKGRGPWQGGRGKQTMQPRFANYGTLRYKLWQFLVKTMAVSC